MAHEYNSLYFQGKELRYFLTRKNVKNINIRVKPDAEIYVSANQSTPLSCIEDVLKSNFYAIEKSVLNAASQLQKIKTDATDSRFTMLWGEQIETEVVADSKKYIHFCKNKIKIHQPENDPDSKSEIINRWKLLFCKDEFIRINNKVFSAYKAAGYNVPKAFVILKRMKSKWGRCTPSKGEICINSALADFPKECAEAVFFHEYAHFINPNHSKDFYDVLLKLYPDYYKIYDYLKENSLYLYL